MSKWISVDERLPEVAPVLMCFDEAFMGTFVPVMESGYYDEESAKWRFWTFDREVVGRGVTHWQPLPEPPK